MEKQKTNEKNEKMPLWAVGVIVLSLCFIGYKVYETIDSNNKKGEWASPTPTIEAISKKSFEDLPVGLIYEVSKEDQEAYLETAKIKYELYKDLGPQQINSHAGYNVDNYLKTREDVIARGNSSPMDMLNDDFSLRYPDMFYGFIIHDENITGEGSKMWADFYNENESNADFRSDKKLAEKMNQIFYIEDQYINGTMRFFMDKKLGYYYTSHINDHNESGYYPQSKMIARGIKSGFFGNESIKDVTTMFDYMFASTSNPTDQYQAAYDHMHNRYSSNYYNVVNKIDAYPEKYNDVGKWDDTYAVYFYPKAVWKVDNNTIVVDIAVVNGDKMGHDDMYEILTKLNQANRSIYANDEYNKIEGDTYMVLGRFFDSDDITNGIMPEYGTYCLNYHQIGDWINGRFDGNERETYVFNNKAKKFLSEFYDIIEEKLNNNGTPSTQTAIKQAAKKVGISYQDGLNIYATHYSLSTMNYTTSIQWQ